MKAKHRIKIGHLERNYKPPTAQEARAARARLPKVRSCGELLAMGKRLLREGMPAAPSNVEMQAYRLAKAQHDGSGRKAVVWVPSPNND